MAKIESASATVRGPLHEKLGIERQDAAGHLYLKDLSSHIIVVADGHGDPSCARSATGSSFAVEVTKERLSQFARAVRTSQETHQSLLKGTLDLSRLTDSIVSAWSSKVATHYAANPEPELDERMASASDAIEAKAIREHLYGTTLVAALLMPDSCIIIQQGDGCCALIYSDGTVRENDDVIIADPLCVGNVTTSLSDRAAASEIRTSLVIYDDAKYVIGCFVGSDGIDKSLPPDGGTSDFAVTTALARLDSESNDDWQDWLADHTYETTDNGSGDDASAAAYVDIDSLRTVELALRTQHERFAKAQRLTALRKKLNSMQRKRAYYLSGKVQGPDEQRDAYLREYDALAGDVKALEEELGDQSDWEAIERSFLEAAKRSFRAVPADGDEPEDTLDETQQVVQAHPQAEVIPFAPSQSSSDEAFAEIEMGGSNTARIIRIVAPIVGALVLAGIALFIIFRPVKELQSSLSTKMASPMSAALAEAGGRMAEESHVVFGAGSKVYEMQEELIRSDSRAEELTKAGVDLSGLKEAARKGLHVSLVRGENGAQTSVTATPVEEEASSEEPAETATTPHDDDMKGEDEEGSESSGDGGFWYNEGSARGLGPHLHRAAGEESEHPSEAEDSGAMEQDGNQGLQQPMPSSNDDAADESAEDGVADDADYADDTSDETSAGEPDAGYAPTEPSSEEGVPATTASTGGVTFTVRLSYDGPNVGVALADAYDRLRSPEGGRQAAQGIIDKHANGEVNDSADKADEDGTQAQPDDSADASEQGASTDGAVTKNAEPQEQTCVIKIDEVSVGSGSAGATSKWTFLEGDARLRSLLTDFMGLSLGSSAGSYADDPTDEAANDEYDFPSNESPYADDDGWSDDYDDGDDNGDYDLPFGM